MLIDEILRALRDPEYRAQLASEVGAALPDRLTYAADPAEPEQETSAES
jgi:hypothetical protein